jgi:Na+(H+)/acetate symporter ActP
MGTIAQQICVLTVIAGGEAQQSEQLQNLTEQRRKVNQQKRRVTVILVTMCVIFGISSLPHTMVSLMTEFDMSK